MVSRVPAHRPLHRSAAYRAIRGAWNDPVVVACSGGIDSSALVVLAAGAQSRGDVGPFVVVHVDHRTRPESAAEAGVVAELCRRLDVPFVAETVQGVAEPGESVEAALRQARYAALARVCTRLGLSSVVTAHTKDDQVETVLLRLLSGSGPVAASGMRRSQCLRTPTGEVNIVRPLLRIPRRDLERVTREAGVIPIIDPTNDDSRYRRNAIRQLVSPVLREYFSGYEDALLRAVELSARDSDLADREASDVYDSVVTENGNSTLVSRAFVRSAHPSIVTRVIRRAAASLIPGDQRELTFERIESVRVAASGRSGAVIEIPGGLNATVARDVVDFRRMDA